MKLAVAVTAAALAFASPIAFATPVNIVENGSFEIPRIDHWATFPDIPGWRASEGGLEIQPNGTVPGVFAFDGRQYAELDTYVNSMMWQNLDTIVGQAYTLTFAYLPRPDNRAGAASNKIETYWNGEFIDMHTGTKQDGWTVVTINDLVSRPGGGTQLLFMATGTSDSFGGFIDAVSVTAQTLAALQSESPSAVSEPGALGLMLGGLFALGFTTRKKLPTIDSN